MGVEPTLLAYLLSSLSTFPTGSSTPTNLKLEILTSQPRRSYALFPHSSPSPSAPPKIFQTEVLVKLYEQIPVSLPSSSDPAATSLFVPIFALESTIYTLPSSSTSLLYISKVDTSGLSLQRFSPARTLVSAYVAYHLLFPPNGTGRVRIHVFAKAQGQYLFPGSIDNKGKKILDGKGLCRWWKNVLGKAAEIVQEEERKLRVGGEEKKEEAVQLFYLFPGLSYVESLPYVPASTSPTSPPWSYTHSFSLPSPLVPRSPLSASTSSKLPTFPIAELLPSFPDDPKSRFLHSLTSSSISVAGSEGDYDDVYSRLHSAIFNGTSTWSKEGKGKLELIDKERERERNRLVGIGMDEWWERMAFRQECNLGDLVGFFAACREVVPSRKGRGDGEGVEKETEKKGGTGGITKGEIPFSSFSKLSAQFHKVDYTIDLSHIIPNPPLPSSSTSPATSTSTSTTPPPGTTVSQFTKFQTNLEKWDRDFKSIVLSEGHFDGSEKEEREREFESVSRGFVDVVGVEKDSLGGKRERDGGEVAGRKREEEKKVNVMVPRKKVKK